MKVQMLKLGMQIPFRTLKTLQTSAMERVLRVSVQLSPDGSSPHHLHLALSAAAKLLQSCPTLRPQRQQPTRLSRPWDSPGKNTGVGCHFLLQYMKVKSESEVAQSFPTLSDPMDCSLPGSSVHGFSRQEYWSGVPLPSPLALSRRDVFTVSTIHHSYYLLSICNMLNTLDILASNS